MKERVFQGNKSAADAAEEKTTGHKKDETAVWNKTALLDSIIANTPIVLWAVDRTGKILLCEGKGLEACGKNPRDLIGKSLLDIHKNVPPFARDFKRALSGEFFCPTEQVKMGEKGIAFDNWQGPLYGPDGEIIGVAGVAVDSTQRAKTEDNLRAEQLQMERLIDSHERDRRLTAYEIHDGLVQNAIGAQMHLETLLQGEEELSDRARSVIGICRELVQNTIIEARHLISGLRPPILDEQGLIPAIQHLVNSHNEGGQNIVLHAAPGAKRMTPLIEGTAFRIAQEAIANAVRHSQSKKIQVGIKQTDDRLELEVLDFGIGFDPANIKETSFGIRGMRERARLLSSQVNIESSPGQGARVFLKMPITAVPEVSGKTN